MNELDANDSLGADDSLGALARARKAAGLAPLLLVVRRRRRRRRAVQAATVVLLAALSLRFLLPSPDAAAVALREPIATAPDGREPFVLERLMVPTTVRAEWFVDDPELQQLLRDAGRPAGLVRIGERVQVDAAAVDPWPAASAAEAAPEASFGP